MIIHSILKNRALRIAILLWSCISCSPTTPQTTAEESATQLTKRLLPEHWDQIQFKEVETTDKDVFSIENKDGQLCISGNSGLAMTSGLHWYLNTYCKAQISLNYNQLSLPPTLPPVDQKMTNTTPFEYRYLFNYCTYGYSLPWWDWNRWEQMIDYMALKGINMPLAVLGQEAVWEEVFIDLGMTKAQTKDFFVGPAHLPWGRMGNIDGLGGPLPDGWIQQQKELQIKILKRMRSLGMKPVLQAFTGHVPETLKTLYPEANITQINDWAGIPGTYFLDPTDRLFKKISTAFIKKQTAIFGTDHLYDADCFIEVDPPSGDPEFLKTLSANVYGAMAEADPEATWVLQGWFFFFKKDFWTQERGKAFMNGIPQDKVITLDLYGEKNPTWDKTEAFFGQPWIWNVICNEDQKVNMSGDLQIMETNFQTAYRSEIGNNLKGIGVIPDGVGYNPIVQDFIFDKTWNQEQINTNEWIAQYVTKRYGAEDENAQQAWKLLTETTYARTRTLWSPLLVTPRLRKITTDDPFDWDMDVAKLYQAAILLQASGKAFKDSQTHQFDLSNVWRELAHSFTNKRIHDLTIAYEQNNMDAFNASAKQLVNLLDDLELVTATNEHFLLGKWLEDAKSWAQTPEEATYYEWNAKTIISIWQPWKEGALRDYAGKQWNGMFSGYYKPRWELFIAQLRRSMEKGTPFDAAQFDMKVRKLDYYWTKSSEEYPASPTQNIQTVGTLMQKKYSAYFE